MKNYTFICWTRKIFCVVLKYFQKTSFLKVNPNSSHLSLRVLPSAEFPQKKTVTFPILCSLILVNTLFQLGRPALVRLLYLQLRQELHKPLETFLITVNPEEVHLLQVEHVGQCVVAPLIVAVRTFLLHLPVPVHD